MTTLKDFNPLPITLNVINKRGKIKEVLTLRGKLTLEDEVWIDSVGFATNPTRDNGLENLNERLKVMTDIEAVFTMVYRLLKDSKYKSYEKFKKRFKKASSVIPEFYKALELVFLQSQPQIEVVDYGRSKEKKSPQIGQESTLI